MKKIACVFLFLLSGCASFFHEYDASVPLEEQLKDSGIVVFNLCNGDTKGEYEGKYFSFLFENKNDKGSYRIAGMTSSRNVKLLFEPGEYYLKDISTTEKGIAKVWSGFDKSFEFKVNRGEAIYIGDVIFIPSKRGIIVFDDFEATKKILKKRAPALAEVVRKDLAK